jgi:hypothetical protein
MPQAGAAAEGIGTMHAHSHTGHADEQFPTDTTDLEAATDPETVEIADGGAVDLRIGPVKKQLGDATVRMLASTTDRIPAACLGGRLFIGAHESATLDRVDTVVSSRTRRCGDLLVASERPVALPSCPGGWHFVGAATASTP